MPSVMVAKKEAIAALLQDLEILDGIDIIIDRQHDLQSAIDASVAKASGAAVLVGCTRGKNRDLKMVPPRFDTDFTVSVWTLPIIVEDGEGVPGEELMEAIAVALHGEELPGSPPGCSDELEVGGWKVVADDTYLIHALDVAAPVQL